MADTIQEAIENQAKADVQSSSVDGVSITHMSVDDKIKADRFAAGKTSAAARKVGLRMFTVKGNSPT